MRMRLWLGSVVAVGAIAWLAAVYPRCGAAAIVLAALGALVVLAYRLL